MGFDRCVTASMVLSLMDKINNDYLNGNNTFKETIENTFPIVSPLYKKAQKIVNSDGWFR